MDWETKDGGVDWQKKFIYNFKHADNFSYHNSEDIGQILGEPTYIFQKIPIQGTDTKGTHIDAIPSESRSIYFDAYNGDAVVSRGENSPGININKSHLITKSLSTVENMIYEWCLVDGKNVTHIVRKESRMDKDFKRQSLNIGVYEFHPDEKTLIRYWTKISEIRSERESRLLSLEKKLMETGTTL